ncbi:MAG TPA: hypothetical protein PLW01_08710 [Agitococcus sp.]|nr:hypothetical protein [Agitococcus sp.]
MNNNLIIVLAILSIIAIGVVLWYHFKKDKNKQSDVILSSPQLEPAQFSQLQARAGFSSDVVLHVAASIAKSSNHRLAQAIVNEASKRQVPMNPVNEFKDLTGYGLTGIVDGRIIALGSQQLMSELGINTIINHQELAASQPANTTIIYVSINSYLAGIIMISDPLQAAF